MTLAVDAETSREERARNAAEVIRSARGYRWVGIYDVGDDDIALLGWTGETPPPERGSGIDRGLSGDAVRSRARVSNGVETIVPILGAESGIVIGALAAESARSDAPSDDGAFLERCAAILRPLYD